MTEQDTQIQANNSLEDLRLPDPAAGVLSPESRQELKHIFSEVTEEAAEAGSSVTEILLRAAQEASESGVHSFLDLSKDGIKDELIRLGLVYNPLSSTGDESLAGGEVLMEITGVANDSMVHMASNPKNYSPLPEGFEMPEVVFVDDPNYKATAQPVGSNTVVINIGKIRNEVELIDRVLPDGHRLKPSFEQLVASFIANETAHLVAHQTPELSSASFITEAGEPVSGLEIHETLSDVASTNTHPSDLVRILGNTILGSGWILDKEGEPIVMTIPGYELTRVQIVDTLANLEERGFDLNSSLNSALTESIELINSQGASASIGSVARTAASIMLRDFPPEFIDSLVGSLRVVEEHISEHIREQRR